MRVEKDFEELLKLFNKEKVDFVIVGSYALAFHGAPRYTEDIDVFVKPDKLNAQKVLKALQEFGFGSLDLSVNDFSVPEKIIQLGVPPVRIDLITALTGVTWEQVVTNKVKGKFGSIPVYFMGRKEFVKNKKATARHKDLADIEALGENKEK